MMNLVVEISRDGTILVYAEDGVAGEACSLAVRNFAQKLGVIEAEAHLPEYYGTAEEANRPLPARKQSVGQQ
jgi:hypothetical protein